MAWAEQQAILLRRLVAGERVNDAVDWRSEAGTFLDDAGQRFTPSMRQQVGLQELYADWAR